MDFDVGLRNLDLVMGAERRAVFDLIDVIQGVTKLSQALIRDKRIDKLWLLPASQTRDKDALTEEGVANLISELRTQFDWILCDSPAGIERGALAMRHADAAVVVTNPEVSSVRDSDRIISLLDSKTEKAEKGECIAKHVPLDLLIDGGVVEHREDYGRRTVHRDRGTGRTQIEARIQHSHIFDGRDRYPRIAHLAVDVGPFVGIAAIERHRVRTRWTAWSPASSWTNI